MKLNRWTPGKNRIQKEGDMGFIDVISFQNDKRKSGDLCGFLKGGAGWYSPNDKSAKAADGPLCTVPGGLRNIDGSL